MKNYQIEISTQDKQIQNHQFIGQPIFFNDEISNKLTDERYLKFLNNLGREKKQKEFQEIIIVNEKFIEFLEKKSLVYVEQQNERQLKSMKFLDYQNYESYTFKFSERVQFGSLNSIKILTLQPKKKSELDDFFNFQNDKVSEYANDNCSSVNEDDIEQETDQIGLQKNEQFSLEQSQITSPQSSNYQIFFNYNTSVQIGYTCKDKQEDQTLQSSQSYSGDSYISEEEKVPDSRKDYHEDSRKFERIQKFIQELVSDSKIETNIQDDTDKKVLSSSLHQHMENADQSKFFQRTLGGQYKDCSILKQEEKEDKTNLLDIFLKWIFNQYTILSKANKCELKPQVAQTNSNSRDQTKPTIIINQKQYGRLQNYNRDQNVNSLSQPTFIPTPPDERIPKPDQKKIINESISQSVNVYLQNWALNKIQNTIKDGLVQSIRQKYFEKLVVEITQYIKEKLFLKVIGQQIVKSLKQIEFEKQIVATAKNFKEKLFRNLIEQQALKSFKHKLFENQIILIAKNIKEQILLKQIELQALKSLKQKLFENQIFQDAKNIKGQYFLKVLKQQIKKSLKQKFYERQIVEIAMNIKEKQVFKVREQQIQKTLKQKFYERQIVEIAQNIKEQFFVREIKLHVKESFKKILFESEILQIAKNIKEQFIIKVRKQQISKSFREKFIENVILDIVKSTKLKLFHDLIEYYVKSFFQKFSLEWASISQGLEPGVYDVIVIITSYNRSHNKAQIKIKENTRSINETFVFLSSIVRLSNILGSSLCQDVFMRIKKYKVHLTDAQNDRLLIKELLVDLIKKYCLNEPVIDGETTSICPPIHLIHQQGSLFDSLIKCDDYKNNFVHLTPQELCSQGLFSPETFEKIKTKVEQITPTILFLDENFNRLQKINDPIKKPLIQSKAILQRFSTQASKKSSNRFCKEQNIKDLPSFSRILSESTNEKFIRGFNVVSNIFPSFQKFAKTDFQEEDVYSDEQDDPFQLMIQSKLVEIIIRILKQANEISFKTNNCGGHIIALKQITQFEQALLEIINRLYQPNMQKRPKIAIITAQNNRAAQVSTTLEQQFPQCSTSAQNSVMDKTFSLYKSQVIKKSNQSVGSEQWKRNFNDYDVFLFLPKIFQDHLMHSDFQIEQFDIIIFDELHNCQVPDHLYNQIMTEHYFNNHQINRLPLIFGMISFDLLFKQADQIAQIQNSLMFYSNMLNSSLLTISEAEAIQIYKIYLAKFTINNRVSLQKPFLRFNNYQEILRFVTNMQQNLVEDNREFRKALLPHKTIFQIKKLDPYIILQTNTGSKITIQDSKKLLNTMIQVINNELGVIKDQIKAEKKITLKIESSQFVHSETKIRYFSSRIQVDFLFSQLLGHPLEKEGDLEWFHSWTNFALKQLKNQFVQNQANDLLIFKKKLESENYLYLHLVYLFCKQEFLSESLVPNELNVRKFLKEFYKLKDPAPQAQIQEMQKIQENKPDPNKAHQNQYFIARYQEFKDINDQLESIYEKNRVTNMSLAIVEYNKVKLDLIIKKVINPILQAVYEYEQKVSQTKKNQHENNEQQINQNYAISWMSLDNNMNSFDIEDRLFNPLISSDQNDIAQDLYNPQPIEVAEENQISQAFSQYTAKLFNAQQQQPLSQEENLKKLLVEINSWVEELQMPAFLNSHYDFSKFIHKNNGQGKDEKYLSNRIAFLKILIIAMTENETSNIEYRLIKEEMERLAFVGDSIINTAVIINLYFKYQGGLNEKEFDKRKIATIKSSNLEQHAMEYGLHYLMLKSKYQDKNDLRSRRPNIVLQSLVGFLGIYIGFSSAYLLLHEIGLVKSNQVQQEDHQHFLKVLEELSQQYQRIVEFEKIAKSELYKQIIENKNELNLELQKHEQNKQLEKLESAKSLVQSCAQQPKEFNFKKKIKPDPKYYQPHEEPLVNYSKVIEEEKQGEGQIIKNPQDEDQNDEPENEQKNQDLQEIKPHCLIQYKANDAVQIQNFSQLDPKKTQNIPDNAIQYRDKDGKLIHNFSQLQPQIFQENLSIPSIKIEEEKIDYSFDFQKFKHSHESILIQCFTHKSFSEKLAQQQQRFSFSEKCIKLIKQQRQAVELTINVDTLDQGLLIRDFILQFNFQIYEYLGDSILNQTMAKYYYLKTALQRDQKYYGCFGAQKLHDLKTWITSNHWLASLLCEHFYSNLVSDSSFKDEKI